MASPNQERDDKAREERWQDCLKIMEEVVSECILEFNIMQAGQLKSGSALVRRLIELLGSTEFPLNDDKFMNRVVDALANEQERLAIRKEQDLSQDEFMRLRRMRLLGLITPDEERYPDGPKQKTIKPLKDADVDRVREWEKTIVSSRDSDEVKRIIANLQGKSAEEQSSIILKVSSIQDDEDIPWNRREHPLLRDFDKCQIAKGLYEIAEKMIV